MTVQKVHYNLSPSVLVRETELAHNRETLHKDTHSTDFTGNWFFYKEKIKDHPAQHQVHQRFTFVSSLFLLSIISGAGEA